MAKIDVERTGGTTPWAWIIGIIVLILLVLGLWALLRDGDETDEIASPAPGVIDDREGVSAGDGELNEVQDLGVFVREGSDRHDIGSEHEYANEGLENVADAIDALAQRANAEDQVSAQTDTIRTLADRLQRDEEAQQHANFVRRAGIAAADAMERLQGQGVTGGDVASVRSAANDIDPETQLLDQRTEMQNFFDRAHQALEAMSGQTSNRTGAAENPGAS